jgi:hypothetical protein
VIPSSTPSAADGARRAIGHGHGEADVTQVLAVEIEGAGPETFKIGFEFSDEEGSDFEFYFNLELPEGVSEKLGAAAVDFINNIGDVVHRWQPTGGQRRRSRAAGPLAGQQ